MNMDWRGKRRSEKEIVHVYEEVTGVVFKDKPIFYIPDQKHGY